MTRRAKALQAIVLVVTVLSLWSCKNTDSKAVPDAGSAEVREADLQLVILNADEYKQEIMDIDRLVFGGQPFAEERRASLAAKLEELAKRVKGASDSKFLEIEAYEIRRLGEVSKSMPEETLRRQLPNQWMRIRNNLFDDRSWFARSAADLDPAPNGSQ